ncbi:hypothetical protein D3C87_1980850 [compost metagenome]
MLALPNSNGKKVMRRISGQEYVFNASGTVKTIQTKSSNAANTMTDPRYMMEIKIFNF